MRKNLSVFFAVVLFAFAVPSFAAVEFEGCLDQDALGYPTPCSFVGKGTVQSAFKWNNKIFQLKSENPGIEFIFEDSTTYSWSCQHYVKGELKQTKTKSKSQKVPSSDVFEKQRKNSQFLGWDLYGPVTLDNDGPPADFKKCPAENSSNDNNGVSDWVYVEDSAQITGGRELQACLKGTEDCRTIWIAVLDTE
jgi:hypothetical protein